MKKRKGKKTEEWEQHYRFCFTNIYIPVKFVVSTFFGLGILSCRTILNDAHMVYKKTKKRKVKRRKRRIILSEIMHCIWNPVGVRFSGVVMETDFFYFLSEHHGD